MQLTPRTVRDANGHTLNQIDIALRNDGEGDYLENRVMYQVAIIDGIAKVYTCSRPDLQFITDEWDYVEDLGAASAVAVEFNGHWERIPNGRFRFYSEGEPYYFLVQDGNLNVMRRSTPEGALSTTLLATGVSCISTVRGWKNPYEPAVDQGLIVAYITGGVVYYRNFAEQSDETWIWESEKEIEEFDAALLDPPVFVSAFRTMDYRCGFLAQFGTTTRMVLTQRRWSRMGVSPESLIGTVLTEVDFNRITHHVVGDGPYPTDDYRSIGQKGEHEESLKGTLKNVLMFLWADDTLPILAENVESVDTRTEEAWYPVPEGLDTEYQSMWYPLVVDSETIYVASVEQTKDVDYTINYVTGQITFTSTPSGEVTGSYQWYSMGHKVMITFDRGIQNKVGHEALLAMVDSLSANYSVYATEGGDPWADPIPPARFEGTRQWLFTSDNFNECDGDLTIDYTEAIGSGLQGEAGQDVGTFQIIFTPTGLIEPRAIVDPPEVEAIWNE